MSPSRPTQKSGRVRTASPTATHPSPDSRLKITKGSYKQDTSPKRSLVVLQSQLEDAIGATRESGNVFWNDPELEKTFPLAASQGASSFIADDEDNNLGKNSTTPIMCQGSEKGDNIKDEKGHQKHAIHDSPNRQTTGVWPSHIQISLANQDDNPAHARNYTSPSLAAIDTNQTAYQITGTAILSPTKRFLNFLSGKQSNSVSPRTQLHASGTPPNGIPSKAAQFLGTNVPDHKTSIRRTKSITFRPKFTDGKPTMTQQTPKLRVSQSVDQNLGRPRRHDVPARASTVMKTSAQDRRIEILNARIAAGSPTGQRSGSLTFYDNSAPPTPPSKSDEYKKSSWRGNNSHILTSGSVGFQHEQSPTTMMVQSRKMPTTMTNSPSFYSVHGVFGHATPSARHPEFPSTPLQTHFEGNESQTNLQQALKPEEFLQATVYTPQTYQKGWKPASSVSPSGLTKQLCPGPLKLDFSNKQAPGETSRFSSSSSSDPTETGSEEEITVYFDLPSAASAAATPQRVPETPDLHTSPPSDGVSMQTAVALTPISSAQHTSPLLTGSTACSVGQQQEMEQPPASDVQITPNELRDLVNWNVTNLHDTILSHLKNVQDASNKGWENLQKSIGSQDVLLSKILENQKCLEVAVHRVEAVTVRMQQELLSLSATRSRAASHRAQTGAAAIPASKPSSLPAHMRGALPGSPSNRAFTHIPTDPRAYFSALGRDRSIPDLMNHPYYNKHSSA